MQHLVAVVLDHIALAEQTYRVRLECAPLAASIEPGQFVMLRLPGRADPLLGRPFALYDIQRNSSGKPCSIDVVYHVVGKMTRQLAELRPGEPLEVWGPLGQRFPIFAQLEPITLVAGGIGQTPFLAYTRELLGAEGYGSRGAAAQSPQVTLVYGARTAARLAGVRDFQEAGADVLLTTDDGSMGERGTVIDVLERRGPTGPMVGCGPLPMLRALAALAQRWSVPCWVSLETPMACGVGICYSCVAPVRVTAEAEWDYKRVCLDGPTFNAAQLVWEAM
jgi:dihydroorotate dehydrogenase electron transfer subunit